MVVKYVHFRENSSVSRRRGKEWRSEAPAERICLAAVSFCHIKDYGRITINELEDKQKTYPAVCEWACQSQWKCSFVCCLY